MGEFLPGGLADEYREHGGKYGYASPLAARAWRHPDFFAWYKQFLMPEETEKHIYLENTHRNPLSDDELAKKAGGKVRRLTTTIKDITQLASETADSSSFKVDLRC